MVTKICKKCKKPFGLEYRDDRVKYCSKCAKRNRGKTKAPHPMIKCPVCGKKFKKKNSLHRFCSLTCKDRFHSKVYQDRQNTIIQRCKYCHRQFSTYKTNKDYCSEACYNNAKRKRERKRRGDNKLKEALSEAAKELSTEE